MSRNRENYKDPLATGGKAEEEEVEKEGETLEIPPKTEEVSEEGPWLEEILDGLSAAHQRTYKNLTDQEKAEFGKLKTGRLHFLVTKMEEQSKQADAELYNTLNPHEKETHDALGEEHRTTYLRLNGDEKIEFRTLQTDQAKKDYLFAKRIQQWREAAVEDLLPHELATYTGLDVEDRKYYLDFSSKKKADFEKARPAEKKEMLQDKKEEAENFKATHAMSRQIDNIPIIKAYSDSVGESAEVIKQANEVLKRIAEVIEQANKVLKRNEGQGRSNNNNRIVTSLTNLKMKIQTITGSLENTHRDAEQAAENFKNTKRNELTAKAAKGSKEAKSKKSPKTADVSYASHRGLHFSDIFHFRNKEKMEKQTISKYTDEIGRLKELIDKSERQLRMVEPVSQERRPTISRTTSGGKLSHKDREKLRRTLSGKKLDADKLQRSRSYTKIKKEDKKDTEAKKPAEQPPSLKK